MKKFILTLTALSVINTVNANTLDLVDINAYMKSPSGIITLTADNIENQIHTIVLTGDGLKNSSEFDYNNGELEWAGEWFKDELTRTENSRNSCSPTNTNESISYVAYPLMKVGSTSSNYSEYNSTAANNCGGPVKNEPVQESESISLLAKMSFQRGSFNFDDCILVEQVRSWGRIDLKTLCLGKGLVEYTVGYRDGNNASSREYKLTSVEALPAGYIWEHQILTLNTDAEINAANEQLTALLAGKAVYFISDDDGEMNSSSVVEGVTLNLDGTLTDAIDDSVIIGETWKIENGLFFSIEENETFKDRLIEVTDDYIVMEEVGENHDGPFRLYFDASKAEAYIATLPEPTVQAPAPM